MGGKLSIFDLLQLLAAIRDTACQFGVALADYSRHLAVAGVASLLIGVRPFTARITRSRPKLYRQRGTIGNVVSIVLLLLIFTVSSHRGRSELGIEQLQGNRIRLAKRVTFLLVELTRPGDQAADSATQAVGEVAAITFEDLRILFPGTKFRTVSLFLWMRASTLAKDLIHTPEPGKDYPFLGEQSLVVASIERRERRYCPDLARRDQYGQCSPFKEPAAGAPMHYASLLCIPLTYENAAVGALCLDAVGPHAFDAEVNMMASRASEEIEQVATLLWVIQNIKTADRRCAVVGGGHDLRGPARVQSHRANPSVARERSMRR